jgi:hypothetical protein
MKNLPTAALLIFFLGFILASSSYAKVLPIIEGSELLDTLASQSNEEPQMPFKHMIHYVDKYPSEILKYDNKSKSYYSGLIIPFDFFLYPIPKNKIRFTRQTLFLYYLENI